MSQKHFRRTFLGFTPRQFPGGGFQFREAGGVGKHQDRTQGGPSFNGPVV
jgi:hypothetical protein